MTDTESRRVLLVSCGDVGTALGLRLSDRGWSATGVRRHADRLPAPLAGVSLDLTDPGETRLPDVDAVVVTLTADGHDVAGYEHTYLGGLRGLRRALGKQEPLVVLVSSTGVLGGGDGERVTETTPPDPQRPTAHVLLAAEELAAELFPDLVIVRPAGIYGPGRTSMVERVRRGAPLAHRRVTNRIHRDDLVTVLATVLSSAEPPRLLHAVDHDAALLGTWPRTSRTGWVRLFHRTTPGRGRDRSARSWAGNWCTPWCPARHGGTPRSGRGTTHCWRTGPRTRGWDEDERGRPLVPADQPRIARGAHARGLAHP